VVQSRQKQKLVARQGKAPPTTVRLEAVQRSSKAGRSQFMGAVAALFFLIIEDIFVSTPSHRTSSARASAISSGFTPWTESAISASLTMGPHADHAGPGA